MVTCSNCGALLREEWDYCGRCGTDRVPGPESDAEEGRLRGALGENLQRSAHTLRRWGGLPAAMAATVAGRLPARAGGPGTDRPSSPSASRPPRMRPSSVSSRGRRSLHDLRRSPLLIAIVAALAVLLAFTSVSWLQARSTAQDARATSAAATSEIEGLATALEDAQATHQAEADALRQELATLEGELAGGSAEVEGLRAQVDAAQGDLDEATTELETLQADLDESSALVQEQQATISTMADCLSGMQVAFAFARSGQQDAAARAYVAVADVCDRARDLAP